MMKFACMEEKRKSLEDHDDDSDNESVHVFQPWAVPTRPTDFLRSGI